MVIQAMHLQRGDILSDGHIVASIIRAQGQTKAKLEDGRLLVVADTYLLGITRPKADCRPVEAPYGLLWA
jgi:hypothetical protein